MNFNNSVNCDNEMATTTISTIEDMCTTNEIESDDGTEALEPSGLPPSFGDAVASFEVVQRYMTAFEIYDVTIDKMALMERD